MNDLVFIRLKAKALGLKVIDLDTTVHRYDYRLGGNIKYLPIKGIVVENKKNFVLYTATRCIECTEVYRYSDIIMCKTGVSYKTYKIKPDGNLKNINDNGFGLFMGYSFKLVKFGDGFAAGSIGDIE